MSLPTRPDITSCKNQTNLEEKINIAVKNGDSIENSIFQDEKVVFKNSGILEINKCILKSCNIQEIDFTKCMFSDCIIEDCDISNTNFEEASFVRVVFKNCKVTGANFISSYLSNVTIDNSNSKYINLYNSKMNNVFIHNTDLSESNLEAIKWKKLVLDNVNLSSSQLIDTSLNTLDIRFCNTEGILVRIEDLQGAIVNTNQAIDFSKLIGIIIKD